MACVRWVAAIALCASALGCGDDSAGAGTAHIGSRDCELIRASTADPATAQACEHCPGAVCGAEACANLPCVDGGVVVQGCNVDDDCAEFPDAPFCGKHQGADNVCVVADDR